MRNLFVDVTAEDIAQGIQMDCCNCPIALAVRRLLPEAVEVTVSPQRIDAIFSEPVPGHDKSEPAVRLLRGITPPEAYSFMRAFDGRHMVQPIQFQVMLYTHSTVKPPRRAIL